MKGGSLLILARADRPLERPPSAKAVRTKDPRQSRKKPSAIHRAATSTQSRLPTRTRSTRTAGPPHLRTARADLLSRYSRKSRVNTCNFLSICASDAHEPTPDTGYEVQEPAYTEPAKEAPIDAEPVEPEWEAPVLRSICCESWVGVVAVTVGEAGDGSPPGEVSSEITGR